MCSVPECSAPCGGYSLAPILSDALTGNSILSDALTGNSILSDALTGNSILSDALTGNSILSDALTGKAAGEDSYFFVFCSQFLVEILCYNICGFMA